MDKLIEKIIKEKKQCFFVSPHLDDALLSSGELISILAKETRVNVVNVFTDGGASPYSLSAKKFLFSCGYRDSKKLFEERILEDEKAFGNLGIEPINLGITDGLFRKTNNRNDIVRKIGKIFPEVLFVYPLYTQIIRGRVSGNDQHTINRLQEKLKKVISKDAYVFCPLGVGKHVDHIIVRDICVNNFRNVTYWVDFPYSLSKKNRVEGLGREKLKLNVDIAKKTDLIRHYKSQFKGLFPDGQIPKHEEIYFKKP